MPSGEQQTDATIRIAVVGAAGRMGREVLRSLSPHEGYEPVVAVDRICVGDNVRDLLEAKEPDLVIEDRLAAALDRARPDVMVDFTHHSAAAQHAQIALKRGISPVIGTTGMTVADLRELQAESRDTGVPGLYAPNFAIGGVLMMHFAEMAARWMPDAEIIEMHHDRKEDAPSGTAMLTAERIAAGRVAKPATKPAPHFKVEGVRGGTFQEVGIHSVRLPGLLAHQMVLFGSEGETLTIRHDSMDRSSFMRGLKLAVREVRGLDGFAIGLGSILFRE
ncbi:MAG: 4-hydroxy-tetrahydrodipicolinate reductase [Fimbriimonas ginsengisoli]|uniref:4-hydroxy-tetrahydrodipicolinate reductase n=1 Tax=Fimbriimonas ginsengisoli TaxID=1005039 RepID=A0A931LRX6_FIMGI|nr:4-hydroxy-tetrahydrodipicolinate reductase [Fimbriimonas ginsengisoli]